MRGIPSHPEYSDSDDAFNALLTQSAVTYVAHGKAFVAEAYSERNFRIDRIKARDDRIT